MQCTSPFSSNCFILYKNLTRFFVSLNKYFKIKSLWLYNILFAYKAFLPPSLPCSGLDKSKKLCPCDNFYCSGLTHWTSCLITHHQVDVHLYIRHFSLELLLPHCLKSVLDCICCLKLCLLSSVLIIFNFCEVSQLNKLIETQV